MLVIEREYTEILNLRVEEIKEKKYTSDLIISEIFNLFKLSDNDLTDIDKLGALWRCARNIFGSDKKNLLDAVDNLLLIKKLALDLLLRMNDAYIIDKETVKNILHELEDHNEEEILRIINQTLMNIDHRADKDYSLQEILNRIENGVYDHSEGIYFILQVLSELDSQSMKNAQNRTVLLRAISQYIDMERVESLKDYLGKINRMDELFAEKIITQMDIVCDNKIVKAINDTLLYASSHNDKEKKILFSVEKLPIIALYTDINQSLSLSEVSELLIEAMISEYKNVDLAEVVLVEEHDEYGDKIKCLLDKYFGEKNPNYLNVVRDKFPDLEDLSEYETWIFLAVILGDTESLKSIPDFKVDMQNSNNQYTPLMYAAKYGNLAVCQYLIGLNANISHLSLYDNKNAFTLALENNHAEIIELLIDNGAITFNKEILALCYKKENKGIIKAIEDYYFNNITFGKYTIKDIIEMFIGKIALNSPYQFNKKQKRINRKTRLAVKNITGNHVSYEEVIGFIDFSTKQKEGMLFASSGIYFAFMLNKQMTRIFQPYFLI